MVHLARPALLGQELDLGNSATSSRSPLTNLAPAILFDDNRKVVGSAPYPVPWAELAAQFATTPYRANLAARFEQWVAACIAIVRVEYVWIGGSFCSDKPEPKDIDAVLFYRYPRPMPQPEVRDAFLRHHAPVLSNMGSKLNFGVDSAAVSLHTDVSALIHKAAYWAMVFSNGPDGTRRAFYTVAGGSFSTGRH